MNFAKYVLCGVLFLLLPLGCKQEQPDVLSRAERLLGSKPDEALALLDSVSDEMESAPTSTAMWFRLLQVEAQYKSREIYASDSLITALVHYYEGRSEPKKLMHAYYHAGSVYAGLKAHEMALDYFHKALELSDRVDAPELTGRVYSRMGIIFSRQGLNEKVLSTHQKACDLLMEAHDSLIIPYALRNIAVAFSLEGKSDSVIHYYSRAVDWARQQRDTVKVVHLLRELASFHMTEERYEEARRLLLWVAPYEKEPSYRVWAHLFQVDGKLDSAKMYYRKAIEQGSLHVRNNAYYNLYLIEKEEGNLQKAMEMIEAYMSCSDTLYSEMDAASLRQLEAAYNFSRMEEEKARLHKQNQRQKISIAFILLIVVGLGVFLYSYEKRKLRERKHQESLLRYVYERQHQQSREFLEENKKQIDELEVKLRVALQEKNELERSLLLARKEQLEQANHGVEALMRSRQLQEDSLRQSAIYRRCYAAINDETIVLNAEEWEELKTTIDRAYDEFSERLFLLHPHLTAMELHICLLLKIGIPVSIISQLVCRTQSAVSMGRKQLYKKIFKKEGSPAMLDQFIASF